MQSRPRDAKKKEASPMPAEASFLYPPGMGINGRGDKIRTCDPLYPKQVRYQAAPLPDARAF